MKSAICPNGRGAEGHHSISHVLFHRGIHIKTVSMYYPRVQKNIGEPAIIQRDESGEESGDSPERVGV
jgi:hypothetical protein